jgi:two-component system, cell cycle response regulator
VCALYILPLQQRLEMHSPHKIALVGFSSFEKATFESFFRLAARRPPGYILVTEPSSADLAVVNADDPATLRDAVAKKPSKQVMLVGSSDGGTGWALQKRPLNLMKVLTNVEQLLSPEAVPVAPAAKPAVGASAPAPLQMVRPAPTGFAETRPFTPASIAPVQSIPAWPAVQAVVQNNAAAPLASAAPGRNNEVRLGAGDFAHSRDDGPAVMGGSLTKPMTSEDDSNVDHILVVDDSDIALKFMRNRLTRFGFRTDLVNSGEEALGRMNTRPYKFVFLDVMMEGLDGYQTCRAIKQRKYSEGKPPVVVMLTSRGGTIDKIRGTLAGCDAYLTKPLNERDLIAVLAKHDRTVARGFQETNFGASVKSGFGASAGTK